jgi:hypothetical protein
VSTRRSGSLPLAGVTKRSDEIVIDLRARCRDNKPPGPLVQRLFGQRFDAEPDAVSCDLDLARR